MEKGTTSNVELPNLKELSIKNSSLNTQNDPGEQLTEDIEFDYFTTDEFHKSAKKPYTYATIKFIYSFVF